MSASGGRSGTVDVGVVREPPLPISLSSPTPAPRPPAPGLLRHALIFGGYLLLTLALTYPIARDLFTRVPGGGDAWQHVWNLWWVKHALLDLHTNPYHTSLIYYPDGVNLYFHTLVLMAGLIGIPLQLL